MDRAKTPRAPAQIAANQFISNKLLILSSLVGFYIKTVQKYFIEIGKNKIRGDIVIYEQNTLDAKSWIARLLNRKGDLNNWFKDIAQDTHN